MSKPPRQHYISKFLIKQWADDNGNVGVVCMYHRDSAIVSADSLHWVRSLSSLGQEDTWDKIENRAKTKLDGLAQSLGSVGDDLAAAKTYLSESENRTPLIDLAVLHYARSLAVPMQQFMEESGTADSAEAEAMIQERWDDAQGYYDCGITITVLPPGTFVPLGAIPVFDTSGWSRYIPNVARFMMPLTPSMVIAGTSEMPSSQADITLGDIDQSALLVWQMPGVPDLFNGPYLICEPSALEQVAGKALEITKGGQMHWHALHNRFELCVESAADTQLARWLKLIERYKHNQGWHADPTTSNSMRAKLRVRMAATARELQAELDRFGAPICACSKLRNSDDPKVAALWRRFMPQVICQAILEKRSNGRA